MFLVFVANEYMWIRKNQLPDWCMNCIQMEIQNIKCGIKMVNIGSWIVFDDFKGESSGMIKSKKLFGSIRTKILGPGFKSKI